MSRRAKDIIVEDAKVMFRNFSGEEGKFNPAGRRNFCVFLDKEVSKDLQEEGWNIKWLEPRDPEDEEQGYLQVSVAYSNVPPKIILISGKGKTVLTEETVGMLDWAEIGHVDLIINPYHWEVNGKTGIKAYVKAMYVTIIEDHFASKYYDDDISEEDVDQMLLDIEADDLPF